MPAFTFRNSASRREPDEQPGVYVTLADLMRLRLKAKGLTFLPRQSPHSVLAGRHASRMRGRGLDFEEIRDYLPGDDIRSFDWKATARAGKPLVRVFTEERDRPTLVVVDQRQAMFFGTKLALKSVTAAETAALIAWRVLSVGDRIGAIVFGDDAHDEFAPRRSQEQVLNILHAIVTRNQALHAGGDGWSPKQLNKALTAAARIAHHDHAVVIVSDFGGADLDTKRLLSQLAQHNDVIAVLVLDPLSREIPERGRLVASNGVLQVEVDLGKGAVRQRLLDASTGRVQQVLDFCHQVGVPVMPMTTASDVVDQIRQLLGRQNKGVPR